MSTPTGTCVMKFYLITQRWFVTLVETIHRCFTRVPLPVHTVRFLVLTEFYLPWFDALVIQIWWHCSKRIAFNWRAAFGCLRHKNIGCHRHRHMGFATSLWCIETVTIGQMHPAYTIILLVFTDVCLTWIDALVIHIWWHCPEQIACNWVHAFWCLRNWCLRNENRALSPCLQCVVYGWVGIQVCVCVIVLDSVFPEYRCDFVFCSSGKLLTNSWSV